VIGALGLVDNTLGLGVQIPGLVAYCRYRNSCTKMMISLMVQKPGSVYHRMPKTTKTQKLNRLTVND